MVSPQSRGILCLLQNKEHARQAENDCGNAATGDWLREDTTVSIARFLSDDHFHRLSADFEFLIKMVQHCGGELELALRGPYFNIYHRGNSLAKVSFSSAEQYRVEISSTFYSESAVAEDKRFAGCISEGAKGRATLNLPADLLRAFFQKRYLDDLCSRIKRRNYSEETAVEQMLICDNRNREDFIIIDRQVAFPGRRDVRMDLLALRQVEPGANRYQFEIIEVKLGNNPDLRGNVAEQLDRYVQHVMKEHHAYKACYERQYEQKVALGLICDPPFEQIEITKEVTGVLVVTGYGGIAQPVLIELAHDHPRLQIIPLSLSLPSISR